MQAGDVDGILGMMTPDAAVSLVPLQPARPDGGRRRVTTCVSWPGPSPTCWCGVRRLFVTGDNTAVAEITIDGTQADAFLGGGQPGEAFDLDQAWMLDGHAGRPDQRRHRVLGPEPALPPARRQTARQDHDHGEVRWR